VLRGWAEPQLLDTYEEERRPVAESNIAWSLQNAKRFGELRVAIANGDSARMAALIADQKGHISALGQDLGFSYEHGCVLPDGTPQPEMTPAHYQPRARPGHRAPAIWLRSESGAVSTIDLYDQLLTLIVGSDCELLRAPDDFVDILQILRIGREPLTGAGEDLHEAHGITRRGAVLVRPDGHVAWRMASLPANPEAILHSALIELGLHPVVSAGVSP
jgi:putative polyketide hydroxylase